MNEAAEFLDRLKRLDVRVWKAGGNIRFSAPAGAMTADLRAEMVRHKPALMDILPTPARVRQEAVETVRPDSPLVVIRGTGDRMPIFCPAPSGGTVYGYADLARLLPPGHPIYAFQTVGLDGTKELLPSVEAIAQCNIDAMRDIRARWNDAPCALLAWSFGGIVAYEMERLLRAQGQRVAMLAMIDTPVPRLLPGGMEDDVALLLALMRIDVPVHRDDVRALGAGASSREQLAYLLNEVKRAGLCDDDFDIDQLCHFMKVHRVNNAAGHAYAPKPTPGKVVFFRPEEEEATGIIKSHDDPTLGWKDFAQGGVDVHFIPGNHVNLMSSPHIEVLARKLTSCLEQVSAAERGPS